MADMIGGARREGGGRVGALTLLFINGMEPISQSRDLINYCQKIFYSPAAWKKNPRVWQVGLPDGLFSPSG